MRFKQWGLSIAGASAATVALAGSALADQPTGIYSDFNHCPLSDPTVTSCLFSQVTSGSFQLGTSTVPINHAITLQGGVGSDPTTFRTFFVNAVGADSLSKTGLDVPGGLLGIVQGSRFTGAPLAAFEAAIHGVNGVTATAELVGPVQINLLSFITGSGTALDLPVRIHLENPFLGSSCYIGSSSSPVDLAMTTGTTAPPSPNTPIAGSSGATTFSSDGGVTYVTGFKLVNNSFSVPVASGCGYGPFVSLITAAVNAKEGLGAAAGTNSATFNASQELANKINVIASESAARSTSQR
jgi:hypothetical protein